MAFTIYRSTDFGAPVLNGITGSLCAVLTASLVTGYGSKSPAGWTSSFSASSKVVLRQGSGSCGFYLNVDDTIGGDSVCTGFETVTSVGTGSGQFPTTIQNPIFGVGALNIFKSSQVSSTPRKWIIFADSKTFYLFVIANLSTAYTGCTFGDIISLSGSADNYRTLFISKPSYIGGDAPYQNEYMASVSTVNTINAIIGHYMPRSYTQTGTSINVGKHGDYSKASGVGGLFISPGNIPYPNPSDGATWLSPVWITEPSVGCVRGKMRGLWQWLHTDATSIAIRDGGTFSGSGDLAGRTFQAVYPCVDTSNGQYIYYVIEISDTVDTN